MNIFSFFQEVKIEEQCSDEDEFDQMKQTLVELSKLMAVTEEYYSSNYQSHKILEDLEKLKANIETLTVIISNSFPLVSNFDYENVRYNGYRSLFRIIKKCVEHLSKSLKKLNTAIMINRDRYEKHSGDYMEFLGQLTEIGKRISKMIVVQRDVRNLFLQQSDDPEVYQGLIDCFHSLNSNVFYGPCLGFYLMETCRSLAKLFCSVQLGFGQAIANPKSSMETFIATVVNSAHSWWMERHRGEEINRLFRQAPVSFCKQCWNLIDHPVVNRWSHIVLPNLKVIHEIALQPIALDLPCVDSDKTVKVSPPAAHSEPAEVKIRLLSKHRRRGMEWFLDSSRENSFCDPSSCLLIHCHGGGFVAQSSQSHDGYLRQWAIDLTYPIVSIDYSHAPEFPYPRAHEECLYAYAWVLKNLSQFGCAPDCKIVMCGDSAGGNLVLGCVLKVLQLNIRVPDGIFLAYPATLIEFVPSPARIIGAFCPILPIGVLARCLLAYGNVQEEYLIQQLNKETPPNEKSTSEKLSPEEIQDKNGVESQEQKTVQSKDDTISPITLLLNANIPSDPMMSPFIADDELYRRFPSMSVFASEFDPLLDDSVELCKKARNAGAKKVHLEVMRNLPHGFLNMATPVTKECMVATKLCVEEIRKLFQ